MRRGEVTSGQGLFRKGGGEGGLSIYLLLNFLSILLKTGLSINTGFTIITEEPVSSEIFDMVNKVMYNG